MTSLDEATVCNLDRRGIDRRANVGIALGVVTVAVAAFVIWRRDLAPWWSLATFPPA